MTTSGPVPMTMARSARLVTSSASGVQAITTVSHRSSRAATHRARRASFPTRRFQPRHRRTDPVLVDRRRTIRRIVLRAFCDREHRRRTAGDDPLHQRRVGAERGHSLASSMPQAPGGPGARIEEAAAAAEGIAPLADPGRDLLTLAGDRVGNRAVLGVHQVHNLDRRGEVDVGRTGLRCSVMRGSVDIVLIAAEDRLGPAGGRGESMQGRPAQRTGRQDTGYGGEPSSTISVPVRHDREPSGASFSRLTP